MMQENQIRYSCTKKNLKCFGTWSVVKVDIRTHKDVLNTFFGQPLAEYEEYLQAVIQGIWEDYVIYEDGQIVSRAAIWWYDNEFGEVTALETLPEYRNCGYGTRLVSELTKMILDKGKYPTTTAHSEQVVVQHIFEKVGYTIE